uniref:RING-type domain-containing protein n=1 Tax=Ditylum brightwellii TaxID=49249 RepID=A0A6V2MAB7_9STRA|mmetsp:Transcript_23337/g.30885  ORF Transcript_23337/g.30885 Transcript_23337/m.30885 type:complete len:1093 (+) Transcript_23337:92-3370(+)
MDDNDVCPLCCEELDLSDRQFFPCKCGYQVCMWCWHRIRESESGLCPACRTPYGDDPHEFSAVDMEEVLKANKEKAAAEKRERERLRQQQAANALGAGSSSSMGYASGGSMGANGSGGLGGMHIGGGSDGDLALAMGSSNAGSGRMHLEPPKDRNQLANMRVIRRNLVYAVGLPPSIATEDTLRKSDYFGQYGKISKIVINRNHNGNGDPRRASASAYVTFLHKEDTLACILALDGFYHDGRNTRASYGTSKYCSAFIKNVRCNNPDCTYLHCMGDSEDTFTKQEIQAGYVTSGRDVLARQQQLMAAASSGSGGSTKRKVGGGGPSGTGKVATSAVFPPPCFDEPQKHSAPGSGISNISSPTPIPLGRRVSSDNGFSAVAAGNVPSAAAVAAGKVPRSISYPNPSTASSQAAVVGGAASTPAATVATTSEKLSRQQEQLRRMHPQNKGVASAISGGTPAATGQKKAIGNVGSAKMQHSGSGSASLAVGSVPAGGPPPTTAASVVAGVHQTSTTSSGPVTTPAPAHTTLTPLTPLKRASSLPVSAKGNSTSVASNTKSSGSNGNNAPSSSSVGGTDSVHLPPNMPVPKGLTPAEQMAFIEQRKESMAAVARQQREMAMKLSALRNGSSNASTGGIIAGTNSSASSPSVSSANEPTISPIKDDGSKGAGVIGGTVISSTISAPVGAGVVGAGAVGSAIGRPNAAPSLSTGIGSLGGLNTGGSRGSNVVGPSGSPLDLGSIGGANVSSSGGSGALGGEAIGGTNGSENIGSGVFPPQPLTSSFFGPNISDKWGSAAHGHGSGTGNLFGGSGGFGIGGTGIWGNDGPAPPQVQIPIGKPTGGGVNFSSVGVVGGSISNGLGGSRAIGEVPSHGAPTAVGGGSLLGKNPFGGGDHNSGSSALASMLGINLPTGSGSLRESSSLWDSAPSSQPPIGGLSSNSLKAIAIGPGPKPGGGSLGGIPIGRGPASSVPIGGFGAVNNSMASVGNSNKSDIAMLQSLLPGVHITSGNAHQPAAPMASSGNGTIGGGGGWGSISGFPSPPPSQQQNSNIPIGVGSLNQGSVDTWGSAGLYSAAPGAPAGSVSHERGQQQRQGSIW